MRTNGYDQANESIRKYVSSPDMALRYDIQHADTDLLKFDTEFLKGALPARGRILDIGCGTARHIIALSANGRDLVGMDLSPHMLDVAAAKLDRAGVAAPLVLADMRVPLPFASESFDAAICMFSTIGIIPSRIRRQAFVREVARVIRPGGVFVFHVHNRLHNLFSGWGLPWLIRTYTWDRLFSGLETGDHLMPRYGRIRGMYLHLFSYREAMDLPRCAGLEVKRVVFLDDDRTGELQRRFRSVRANGFIVVAQREHSSSP